MYGLSSASKEAIGTAIDGMFDKLAFHLLGNIPKLKGKKFLLIGEREKLNLAHIFVQAMNNVDPNHLERDALKSMLDSAHGYVESLKHKTRANVTENIDAMVKEAKARGDQVTREDVDNVFSTEMEKAKSHMKTIAEAESTKTRNVGHTMDISRVASDIGDDDPTVFFVVVRDGNTCKECMRIHMMPDGVTPRLWKLSDVSAGYHKRGEDRPSLCGGHPNCRCSITYLASGFGFKNGFVGFIKPDHDAYADQNS